MKQWSVFLSILLLVPTISYAGVVINEIAWMGSASSATHEWIELFNNGSDVDLSGWTLSAVDGVPAISLSGTVGSNSFFLIKRNAETLTDISGDLIASFGAGLANTGETLILKDGTGAEVDRVEGGNNWVIGGNNTTKQTPQRQSNNSWVTNDPTPRAINATTDAGGGSGNSGDDTPPSSGNSTPSSSVNAYKQKVFVYAGEDREVVVGADVYYEGFAVDDTNHAISPVQYTWSFGDGTSSKGKEVFHRYYVPGTYTVILRARADNQVWKDTITVVAYEAQQTITQVVFGDGGYVAIENMDSRPLDVSGWRLQVKSPTDDQRTQGKQFRFPFDTVIAPSSTVAFSSSVTKLPLEAGKTIALLYPNGTVANWYEQSETRESHSETSSINLLATSSSHKPSELETNRMTSVAGYVETSGQPQPVLALKSSGLYQNKVRVPASDIITEAGDHYATTTLTHGEVAGASIVLSKSKDSPTDTRHLRMFLYIGSVILIVLIIFVSITRSTQLFSHTNISAQKDSIKKIAQDIEIIE